MIAACCWADKMFFHGDRIDVRRAVGQGPTSRFALSLGTS